MPLRFRHFFVPGKQFRTPMFLSTSASRDKALGFMMERGGPDYVLWTIEFDPSCRCDHVNFIDRHEWAAFHTSPHAASPPRTYNASTQYALWGRDGLWDFSNSLTWIHTPIISAV